MKSNRILAISINNYDDSELDKINNCKTDIDNLLKILTEKYTFDDIEYLHEKNDTNRKVLFNKLNEYFINANESDNILLLYAGHGQYNEFLKTAYWQPSDADNHDASTWFNLNDLMTFLKASKAFHISVISDSCFSGAMFESPQRGGGTQAFDYKKSRLGLSSGSLEKVSDGSKGELSPFARTLSEVLLENKLNEFPFIQLGTEVISKFSEQTKQTPMFAPLVNIGHAGGSFVFKLKKDINSKEEILDKNLFLKEQMEGLFVTIPDNHISLIDEYSNHILKKIDAVKAQEFELAASYRKQEKDLKEYLHNLVPDYIESLCCSITLNENETEFLQNISQQVTSYEETRGINEGSISEFIEQKDIPEELQKIYSTAKIIHSISNFFPENRINPAYEIFDKFKMRFLEAYSNDVIYMFKLISKISSLVKSEWLEAKTNKLKELIISIYQYEIDLVSRSFYDELEKAIDKKQIELKLLNWIKNK
ncbi:caspase family protein [Plebeiibacterium sediminum]|uniref:Caspase family protein n=1 Tax=Plebeiibacterium sediminum TaxID=2992112 RepID=A0AAE3M9M4_9BACT|nr:caspase family protein [Plebeiobacterium sediminum]MCW3789709.1 caspase family protein [Plebeiobacterium sediminum]